MKRKRKVITFITLLALLLYLLGPSQAVHMTQAFATNAAAGSTVGGVNVEGLEEDAIRQQLATRLAEWTSSTILIVGGGAQLEVNTAELQFNIEEAIAEYKQRTDKAWYEFWVSKKKVQIPLPVVASDNIKNEIATVGIWDVEGTYANLISQASFLDTEEVEAVVMNLSQLENERISVLMQNVPADAIAIDELTTLFHERVIGPGEELSFIAEYTLLGGTANESAIDFIASLLYNTALNTNMQILERHPQLTIPAYLEPGLEAHVDFIETKDLKIKNTLTQPIKLKVENDAGLLRFEAFTSMLPEQVTIYVERSEPILPRTINRFSSALPVGSKQTLEEGENGLRVIVRKTLLSTGVDEVVSRDFYAPINRIVLNSSRIPIQQETTDTGTNGDSGSNGLPGGSSGGSGGSTIPTYPSYPTYPDYGSGGTTGGSGGSTGGMTGGTSTWPWNSTPNTGTNNGSTGGNNSSTNPTTPSNPNGGSGSSNSGNTSPNNNSGGNSSTGGGTSSNPSNNNTEIQYDKAGNAIVSPK